MPASPPSDAARFGARRERACRIHRERARRERRAAADACRRERSTGAAGEHVHCTRCRACWHSSRLSTVRKGSAMLESFLRLFNDSPAELRSKIVGIYAMLIAFNVGAWAWAFAAFHGQPVLLGTALLAYTFGLRHAVDADHIAAIDNVTRKLMHEKKNPLGAGLFFSLGHSSVVILMTVAVALTAATLAERFEGMKAWGGAIGTSVSAFFLLVLAFANLLILISVYRTFRAVRRGEPLVEQDLDILLNQRGFFARIFRPLFAIVSRSWHLYPIGFLFGLGFDTATEIALFGISATQAHGGLSFWSVMALPVLFTAGMTLVDTTDGIMMMGAYRWAFVRPIRKIYYNMTITFVSVLVAIVIGGIEALALIGGKLALKGGVWDFAAMAAEHFGVLGYFVIGLFAASWIVSALIYRIRRYDDIDVTLSA
ncbi:high-affinity nickel transport protein [Burkholderia mallei PRL-20]|nr:high-affinity nickel transport protein [Burkholderia mallei SAVP1]EDK56472.1 high-affinity nickel transport protein [Burkholderia mallei FMH]EDP88612.1 high-affinity nickel transport protein [Burkholderia mallei ATCC 10399]EEP83393.1 high-affinity nickel transport protein [Burkholderia mallei GB8 horse 4]EES42619.1 high-affinity nickel transport protein [Burkholderia mallei PRL-20]